MKAIDLYSGIGGWMLGLKMAGIDVIASYDWWEGANETLDKNFGSTTPTTDIRELDFNQMPHGVDFVVGSPPCTQFSFSNRGGSGDINEGLKDVTRFLEIVERLEPKYWAMENVPRVKNTLESELSFGGVLERFRGLVSVLTIIDCSDYGLPQRRRRAIAGNFPIDLFESYLQIVTPPTLGDVLAALQSDPTIDPNYLIQMPKDELTDEDYEIPLGDEELRINRAAKQYHTVYNKMAFPDRLDRVSRTITATCTRVSRESIIVKTERGDFRRLSIRESAVLQGFPISFQFYGKSYSARIKMIGNAMPPIISYFIGCSMVGRLPDRADPREHSLYDHPLQKESPIELQPEINAQRYRKNRMFRFAIPHLRFGSGVRFELGNNANQIPVNWRVRYFYGSSKNILEVPLSERLFKECTTFLRSEVVGVLDTEGLPYLQGVNGRIIQDVWIHRVSGTSPFKMLDLLGDLTLKVHHLTSKHDGKNVQHFVLNQHLRMGNGVMKNGLGKKYKENSTWILAGFVIGSWFNTHFKAS